MPSPVNNFEFITNAASEEPAKMYIYSAIGESFWGEGVSANSVLKELKAVPATKPLNVYINSPGGSVYDGMAIHNQLKRHKGKVTCYIDGMCASIATAIALGAEEIIMAENATFMVHEPSTFTSGDIKAHTTTIGRLSAAREAILNTYEAKTKMNRKDIEAAVSVETWYTAKEALEAGFVDSIGEPVEMTNSFDLSAYTNVPPQLKACSTATVEGKMAEVDVASVTLSKPNVESKESTLMTTTPAVEPTVDNTAAIAAAVEAGIAKRLLDDAKASAQASLQAARLEVVKAQTLTPAVAEQIELAIVKDIQNAGNAAELEAINARVKAVFPTAAKAPAVEAIATPIGAEPTAEDKSAFKFSGTIPDVCNGSDHAREAFIADLFAKHLVAEKKFEKYADAAYAVYEDPILHNELLKLASAVNK